MFGRDLKAEAKTRRDHFICDFGARGANFSHKRNATIKELVPCVHAKSGMHHVSVFIKDGHIRSFSCECLELRDEYELKVEAEIHDEGTCYQKYRNLQSYIANYRPRPYGPSDLSGQGSLPILAQVVRTVRHEAHSRLHAARRVYQTDQVGNLLVDGDLSAERIFRMRKLMENIIYNYFHETIAKMFKVRVLEKVLDRNPYAIDVRFKDVHLGYFDDTLRLTESVDAFLAQIKYVTHDIKTDLPDNSQCLFCNNSKVYSRIKGHLARTPHQDEEEKVLNRFFAHFTHFRSSNFLRMKNAKLYTSPPSVGFAKLVQRENALAKHLPSTSKPSVHTVEPLPDGSIVLAPPRPRANWRDLVPALAPGLGHHREALAQASKERTNVRL